MGGLLNPSMAPDYAVDAAYAYAVSGGELLERDSLSVLLSNFSDLIPTKLGLMVSFAILFGLLRQLFWQWRAALNAVLAPVVHVISVVSKPQMLRVYTAAIMAAVKHMSPIRYLSIEKVVRHPVPTKDMPARDFELNRGIASPIEAALPLPAPGLADDVVIMEAPDKIISIHDKEPLEQFTTHCLKVRRIKP